MFGAACPALVHRSDGSLESLWISCPSVGDHHRRTPDSACAGLLIAELDAILEPLYPYESRYGLSVERLIAEGVAFFLLRSDGTPAGGTELDSACQCYTMLLMRTAKTVSITLPPELLVKAQQLAEREHRTMSELFREALRHYMQEDAGWEALLGRTRAQGRVLGITSEEDVERLSNEYRREKHQPSPR